MAGNFNLEQTNSYTSGMEAKPAANSVDVTNGEGVTLINGFIQVAGTNDPITGVSVTKKVFANNNETVAKEEVIYHPTDTRDFYRMKCAAGTTIEFDQPLVAGNDIDLDVNGVAMTTVPFNVDNDTTLDDLAIQLETQFPTLIESAVRSGVDTVAITVAAGANVVITNILVTGGVSQANGTQIDKFTQADVGGFFDIVIGGPTNLQLVDGMTFDPLANQLKLEKVESQSYNIFSITGVA